MYSNATDGQGLRFSESHTHQLLEKNVCNDTVYAFYFSYLLYWCLPMPAYDYMVGIVFYFLQQEKNSPANV